VQVQDTLRIEIEPQALGYELSGVQLELQPASSTVLGNKVNVGSVSLKGNFVVYGLIDGVLSPISVSADNSKNQITYVTVPHFSDSAVIDPSFSYLVDEAPRSQSTENRMGGVSAGVAAGVAIVVIVVVVAISLYLVMPRVLRNRREKIAMMAKMDTYEEPPKRNSTFKPNEKRATTNITPSLQVSINVNSNSVEMKELNQQRKSQRKTQNGTILALAARNEDINRDLVNDTSSYGDSNGESIEASYE